MKKTIGITRKSVEMSVRKKDNGTVRKIPKIRAIFIPIPGMGGECGKTECWKA